MDTHMHVSQERIGNFEMTSLVLANDNSEIPLLKTDNMSLRLQHQALSEQLHLVPSLSFFCAHSLSRARSPLRRRNMGFIT